MSDKLSLETLNLVIDKEQAAKYAVDKVPAIVVLKDDGTDSGIRFFGIPAAMKQLILSALLAVSGRVDAAPGGPGKDQQNLTSRSTSSLRHAHLSLLPWCRLTAHRCPGEQLCARTWLRAPFVPL